jgi:hypothetical protein
LKYSPRVIVAFADALLIVVVESLELSPAGALLKRLRTNCHVLRMDAALLASLLRFEPEKEGVVFHQSTNQRLFLNMTNDGNKYDQNTGYLLSFLRDLFPFEIYGKSNDSQIEKLGIL